MIPAEREKITDLMKCDFREMHDHYVRLREERKALSKEEKQKLKEVRLQKKNRSDLPVRKKSLYFRFRFYFHF